MSKRLTKEQLEARGLVLSDMVNQEATIAALRAENERLKEAATEARKLGMKIYHNANAHEAAQDWAAVKTLLDAALKPGETRAEPSDSP